jgi:hypothetical protein
MCSGETRATYAGKRILVVGAGHSAADVLLDLVLLGEAQPGTQALWATHSGNLHAFSAVASRTSCPRAESWGSISRPWWIRGGWRTTAWSPELAHPEPGFYKVGFKSYLCVSCCRRRGSARRVLHRPGP